MKLLSIILLFSSVSFSSMSTNTASADEIVGTWLIADKTGKVKIYEKNGKYYGKTIWMKQPHDKNGELLKDGENDNTSLRNRPLKGLIFLTGFQYKGGKWINGKIYNPEDGNTYKGEIGLSKSGDLELTGYVSIFSRTVTWKQVK